MSIPIPEGEIQNPEEADYLRLVEPEICFDTEEGLELARSLTVSGYRFKDEGLKALQKNLSGWSFIKDKEQAKLLRDCVIRTSGLSVGLLAACDDSIEKERLRERPQSSNTQIERRVHLMAECERRIKIARSIGVQLTKYFNLPDHEFLNPKDGQ